MTVEKKRKDRSPRYPSLGLREAVEKVTTLYERENRAMVPAVVAVKAWGYNSLNGRSLTMLAAITQYGLLARQNNLVGISDDAFTIIEAPRNSPERMEVLLRCAKAPGVFDDLLQRYPDGLPSDEALRWDLKQRGFTDQGAQAAIACLRETVSFVSLETGGYTGGNENNNKEPPDEEPPPVKTIDIPKTPKTPVVNKPTTTAKAWSVPWLIPLSIGVDAQLTISGTKAAPDPKKLKQYLALLKGHIDLFIGSLPDEEEMEDTTDEMKQAPDSA